ncbi:semaphorin-7A isoform X1 [Pleuronectes platessa]|uniref:semaphorin-7A isoform X1 n=1 Tax=Pleuronectes platessa TaxID=8262 RepID=UPI00232A2CA9|nr:semaphorin-7A isoform X1 [Pleuronectes platessa]
MLQPRLHCLSFKAAVMTGDDDSLTEAHPTHLPRRVFTDKEIAVKRSPVPGNHAPVLILLRGEPDSVTAAGQTHLYTYDFQQPQKAPVERRLVWEECTPEDCGYNITVVHERQEPDQALVCGTDGRETLCCDVNFTAQSPTCTPSDKLGAIESGIRSFIVKEGEPSALVESAESADLYITNSGSQEYVGIHKFGKNRVGPASHNKEQHYVGLMLSRGRDPPLQDKVFAFYKEKNRGTDSRDDMWLPYVTRVCMADIGGRKNNMQLTWTSQMSARLFCGDPGTRQHFSELVDVAVVQADHWQDTRVYGLFRNEWHMTAICVYTIKDFDNIFANSAFEGQTSAYSKDRPRECVEDSRMLSPETLRKIAETSEMVEWVHPVNKSGPLLFNHHNYTHIYADSSQHKRNNPHTVLFLTLNNGAIHKVLQTESRSFFIAEYHPFNHRAHISSIILHPSSRKLYVTTRSELVQLDVENCAKYGDCEECVLARDPYCSWNLTHCSTATNDTLQDLTTGNHTICPVLLQTASRYSTDARAPERVKPIALPPNSKYFLSCPMLSKHAEYTWRQGKDTTLCRLKEQECLLLIDSMSPEQVGTHTCESEELGFKKVLVQYELQLESRAAIGRLSSPLVWVCLVAALIKS